MGRAGWFLTELKRRRVYHVGVAYAIVAFVVWQVADIAVPALGLPDSAVSLILGWTGTDVVTFADPSYVVGVSRIKRGPGHASVILEASELEPGTAATLWAVVFNNASACVGECDDPDLFENAATQADLMYVGGAVADGQGRVRYAGRLGEGDTAASIMPLFGLPAWGVLEASTAEIHLVVRTHGQAIPGLVAAQTSTFNGGCTGFGAEFGAPGPNECLEPYFASHFAN